MTSQASSRDTRAQWRDALVLSGVGSLFGLAAIRSFSAFISFGEVSLGRGFTCAALLFLASLFAWVLADFCSGMIHFLADNYGSAETPLLGRILIAPFRQHHLAPTQMLEHGFLERNANNALATLPFLSWIPLTTLNSPLLLFGAALSLTLSAWILVTNEIHALCHKRPTNRFLLWLQKKGLLLDPAAHALHHDSAIEQSGASSRLPSTRFHYCITSGVCDRWARSLEKHIERMKRAPRPASE